MVATINRPKTKRAKPRTQLMPFYNLEKEQRDIEDLRQRFSKFLDEHYAASTVKTYRLRADRYLRVCGLPDLNGLEIVRAYIKQSNLSPKSISSEIGALVTLYRFDGLDEVASSLNSLRPVE